MTDWRKIFTAYSQELISPNKLREITHHTEKHEAKTSLGNQCLSLKELWEEPSLYLSILWTPCSSLEDLQAPKYLPPLLPVCVHSRGRVGGRPGKGNVTGVQRS